MNWGAWGNAGEAISAIGQLITTGVAVGGSIAAANQQNKGLAIQAEAATTLGAQQTAAAQSSNVTAIGLRQQTTKMVLFGLGALVVLGGMVAAAFTLRRRKRG